MPFVLVGNKADLAEDPSLRQVTEEEARARAREWKCEYFEASAKTRQNVEEAYTSYVRIFYYFKKNFQLI